MKAKLIITKENEKTVGFEFRLIEPKTIFIKDIDVVEATASDELFNEFVKRLETPTKKK